MCCRLLCAFRRHPERIKLNLTRPLFQSFLPSMFCPNFKMDEKLLMSFLCPCLNLSISGTIQTNYTERIRFGLYLSISICDTLSPRSFLCQNIKMDRLSIYVLWFFSALYKAQPESPMSVSLALFPPSSDLQNIQNMIHTGILTYFEFGPLQIWA